MKSSKILINILLISALFVTLISTAVFAEPSLDGLEQLGPHIFLSDRILSSEEISAIESRIENIKTKYGNEHVFVINYSKDWGYSTSSKETFAENLFFDKNYGGGRNNSGSILLIDFYPPPGDRDIVIRTMGDLIRPFENRVEGTISDLGNHLKKNELYTAINRYLDIMEDTHAIVGEVGPSGEIIKPSFFTKLTYAVREPIYLAVAAGLALIVTIYPFFSYRGTKTAGSLTYETPGTFDLQQREDIYSHSHTTSRYSPRKSSSSGGGGSGRSGGGSGKF